jgi:hypothetical protein
MLLIPARCRIIAAVLQRGGTKAGCRAAPSDG